jgi:hypothetical protein
MSRSASRASARHLKGRSWRGYVPPNVFLKVTTSSVSTSPVSYGEVSRRLFNSRLPSHHVDLDGDSFEQGFGQLEGHYSIRTKLRVQGAIPKLVDRANVRLILLNHFATVLEERDG